MAQHEDNKGKPGTHKPQGGIKGRRQRARQKVAFSRGSYRKGHWRGRVFEGSEVDLDSGEEAPMIHVEPDNPWPRK
ncbi:hypothetical protein RCC09_004589 [Vibrio parahaemolyticus]|nr:hypothetical protein [Vibrio parahaemolyticus]ELA7299586.1 hypothetical protein [Vibrio parahaemolyticus]